MYIFLLLFLTTLFYSFFQIFVARTAGKIDATLPGVIGNLVAVVIPLAVFIYLKFGKRAEMFPATTQGIVYSVLAGVAVAIYGILLVKSFERADIAVVIPVVFGGSIALSTLFSWLFLKEQISSIQLAGIIAVIIGVGLIALKK